MSKKLQHKSYAIFSSEGNNSISLTSYKGITYSFISVLTEINEYV